MYLEAAVTAGIAFTVAALTVGYLARVLRGRGKFDLPNERSAHKIPTPRGGGVGLAAGFAAGLAIGAFALGLPAPHWVILAGAGALALVGAWDDWREPLPVGLRLLIQSAAAAAVLIVIGPIERLPLPSPLDFELGIGGYLLGWVWIVGVTNIYNFLDGIDGYAGVQALVAAAALMVFSFDAAFAPAGAALAGAAAGFLMHNWRPARIFLGDSGSTAIGFLIAAMPFQAAPAVRPEATFVAALSLWFFLSDGAYTLLARAFRGEKFWLGHNAHLYQRLVRSGLDHNEVALRIGAAGLILVMATLAYGTAGGVVFGWPPLLLACLAFLALLYWTRNRESRAVGRGVEMTPSAGI